MARISGKNAKIRGVLARTVISVAETMTDGGAQTLYTLTGKPYWNPNRPPSITKQSLGVGPFNPVDASAYTVDYINGTVTFLVANNVADVIKVNGIEWMTLQDIGDMFDWTLDLKIDTVDATAFNDQFAQKLSSFRGWSATAQGYHVSGFWFDAFYDDPAEFYVVFYPDGAATERFVGAGFIDNAISVKKDAAVTDSLTINGTGALARLTS